MSISIFENAYPHGKTLETLAQRLTYENTLLYMYELNMVLEKKKDTFVSVLRVHNFNKLPRIKKR